MRAILLAGGKGTRLLPFTATFPKPLMPLDDVPVIEVLVHQLVQHGVTDLTVVTGHLAELIHAFLGNGERFGVRIDYFREDTPLDTAGCLGLIEPPSEPFLVMNGDLLTTLHFAEMMRFHREHGQIASIATHGREVTIDLGVVEIDGEGELADYREKPRHEFFVSMGIYCFHPEICQHVQRGERISMPELILRLRAMGRTVMCYREDCYWLDIGRPDDYSLAAEVFRRDRSRFLHAPAPLDRVAA